MYAYGSNGVKHFINHGATTCIICGSLTKHQICDECQVACKTTIHATYLLTDTDVPKLNGLTEALVNFYSKKDLQAVLGVEDISHWEDLYNRPELHPRHVSRFNLKEVAKIHKETAMDGEVMLRVTWEEEKKGDTEAKVVVANPLKSLLFDD